MAQFFLKLRLKEKSNPSTVINYSQSLTQHTDQKQPVEQVDWRHFNTAAFVKKKRMAQNETDSQRETIFAQNFALLQSAER